MSTKRSHILEQTCSWKLWFYALKDWCDEEFETNERLSILLFWNNEFAELLFNLKYSKRFGEVKFVVLLPFFEKTKKKILLVSFAICTMFNCVSCGFLKVGGILIISFLELFSSGKCFPDFYIVFALRFLFEYGKNFPHQKVFHWN